MTCPPQPYDYVIDGRDWLHSIKGVMPGGAGYLTMPLYRPVGTDRGHAKCKMGYLHTGSLPSGRPCNVAGPFDYLLSPCDVSRVLKQSVALGSVHSKAPPAVVDLLQAARSLGATVSLVGSRLAGTWHHGSDWDFRVTTRYAPGHFIQALVAQVGPHIRPFTAHERRGRARRYAVRYARFDETLLDELFLRATCYLKSGALEIGVFFARPHDGRIPHLPDLADRPVGNIAGKILPVGGDSYGMPRIIKIRDETCTCHTVLCADWELAGIEELSGMNVAFTNLFHLEQQVWWFGGRSGLKTQP